MLQMTTFTNNIIFRQTVFSLGFAIFGDVHEAKTEQIILPSISRAEII